jgi:hypothetical protein
MPVIAIGRSWLFVIRGVPPARLNHSGTRRRAARVPSRGVTNACGALATGTFLGLRELFPAFGRP